MAIKHLSAFALALALVTPASAAHLEPDNPPPYPVGNVQCKAPVNEANPRSHAVTSWSDNGRLVLRAAGINNLSIGCTFVMTVTARLLGAAGSIKESRPPALQQLECEAAPGDVCALEAVIDWTVYFYDGAHVYIGVILELQVDFWLRTPGGDVRVPPPATFTLAWPCSYGVEADPICTSPPRPSPVARSA